MSVDTDVERRRVVPPASGNGNANGVIAPLIAATHRLSVKANTEHRSDSYDDLQLEFSPLLFSYLEQYLPPSLLNLSRENKILYMRQILHKYWPDGERNRLQRHKEYKEKIIEHYERLNQEIYDMHPANFFVPSFLNAINENKLESLKSIMSEPAPGIYTFEIFQPGFCEMLLAEVEQFERWVCDTKFRIMRPNTMNKYGAVLDDFGLEDMLSKLMDDYIRPLAKVLFPEVGGSTLDSHHGFIVEYGIDRDVDLGFHVDDAEVTLNVCLGKQFSGGELYFRGVRCDKHVSTETQAEKLKKQSGGELSFHGVRSENHLLAKPQEEEIFDYVHVPGHAVLHRGRHRHGARATTDGHRINLILWCRSSIFRELKKYQKDFSSWCGECQREKREKHELSVSATRMELLREM